MTVGKAVLGCIFMTAACTDVLWRRIPNKLIVVGLAAFLPLGGSLLYHQGGAPVLDCLKAGAAAFAIHLIPYWYRQMGAGDVKLAAIAGLLLGWQEWLDYLGYYCVALLLTAVALLVIGKKRPQSLPLAPLMAVAFLALELCRVMQNSQALQ